MPVNIRDTSLKPQLLDRSRTRRKRVERQARHAEGGAARNDLAIPLNIVDVPLTAVKLPKRQVRKFGPDDITAVAQSIRRFGLTVPIILGNDGTIIDGVVVAAAVRELGLSHLPCVRLEHLSEAEERALRLLLNRLGHGREHDLHELKLEFEELIDAGEPIRLLGYTDPEVDQVLLEPLETRAPEPALPDLAPPTSVLGDCWQLGRHRLLCGDAKDPASYEVLMAGAAAQLMLTDPPYGVEVAKVVSTRHRDFVEGGGGMTQADFEAMIRAAFRHGMASLVDGGLLISFMDYKHAHELVVIGKELGFDHVNTITWVKPQAGMGSLWRSGSEFGVALKKPGTHKNNVGLGRHGRDRSNVWRYAGAGTVGSEARAMLKDHPTPKPVAMLVDAILDVTDRDDIILDPFGGSGSALMAAEETDRVAHLIELDPIYCDLIIRRWQQLTAAQALHVATGRTFVELVDERAFPEKGSSHVR